MIPIKNKKEIDLMRKGGRVLTLIMGELKKKIKPGLNTEVLDSLAKRLALENSAHPSFKGYKKFPANICISINSEVVHGLPYNKILKEGDIVDLDFGLLYKGYHTDMAVTVGVGEIGKQAQDLISVAEESLYVGINQVKPGNRVGNISSVIQEFVKSRGYSVVRDLTGHGVGKKIHEPPQVPNFGKPGDGPMLREGMVLAIEPMVNVGNYKIELAKDGWTFVTSDGSLSAHFEHTVAVTNDGYEVLTAF
jgi:methionyl aminopeptidase